MSSGMAIVLGAGVVLSTMVGAYFMTTAGTSSQQSSSYEAFIPTIATEGRPQQTQTSKQTSTIRNTKNTGTSSQARKQTSTGTMTDDKNSTTVRASNNQATEGMRNVNSRRQNTNMTTNSLPTNGTVTVRTSNNQAATGTRNTNSQRANAKGNTKANTAKAQGNTSGNTNRNTNRNINGQQTKAEAKVNGQQASTKANTNNQQASTKGQQASTNGNTNGQQASTKANTNGQQAKAQANASGNANGQQAKAQANANGTTVITPNNRLKISSAQNYGFLTQFGGMDKTEAQKHVRDMDEIFGIKDFQFYDAFKSYSRPSEGTVWKCKAAEMITGANEPTDEIHMDILKTMVAEIKERGGRSWLYVQCLGADEGDLPKKMYQKLDDAHLINNEVLLYCYLPDEKWAKRQCDIWVPFAKEVGFYGIHWDTLGKRKGLPEESYLTFLKACHPIVKENGLEQTMNFVDGFGWSPEAMKYSMFPYWEVWSTEKEDLFFDEMSKLDKQNKKLAVFACYPKYNHKGFDMTPDVLRRERLRKCIDKGVRYLLVGDGTRFVQSEYFPNTVAMTDEDIAEFSGLMKKSDAEPTRQNK